MATSTVLQMTQNILSAMSSDEVNSISDSTESMQVAQILQNKYYDIVARGDLSLDLKLFQLNPSDNYLAPVLMTLPAGVMRLDWLQYYDTNPLENVQTSQFGAYSHDLNIDIVPSVKWIVVSSSSVTIKSSGTVSFVLIAGNTNIQVGQTCQATATGGNSMFGNVASISGTTLTINVTSSTGQGTFNTWTIASVAVPNVPPGYEHVDVVHIEYFLGVTNRLDITQNNVQSYNFTQSGENFTFRYMTDRQPTMCCIVSNQFVLFDSFDNSQDSTLQASKTLAFGQVVPPFLLQDNFTPVLDDHQFSLLLNEAKALAFYELKQQTHALADKEIHRQWTVTQKSKSKGNKPSYFDQLPNYGRLSQVGGYAGYPVYRWMRSGLSNL